MHERACRNVPWPQRHRPPSRCQDLFPANISEVSSISFGKLSSIASYSEVQPQTRHLQCATCQGAISATACDTLFLFQLASQSVERQAKYRSRPRPMLLRPARTPPPHPVAMETKWYAHVVRVFVLPLSSFSEKEKENEKKQKKSIFFPLGRPRHSCLELSL